MLATLSDRVFDRRWLPLLGPLLLFALWQLVISAQWIKPVLLPPPGEVLWNPDVFTLVLTTRAPITPLTGTGPTSNAKAACAKPAKLRSMLVRCLSAA